MIITICNNRKLARIRDKPHPKIFYQKIKFLMEITVRTTSINRKFCPKNVVERRTVIVAPLKRPALLNQKRGRKN
jgi:hypothetical protein